MRHHQQPFVTPEALPLTEIICSLGQIIGGFVTDALGWRWIHWISLMGSSVTILLACLALPYAEARLPPDQVLPGGAPASNKVSSFSRTIKGWVERFDLLGVFTGIPGILLLNYALTSANIVGWGSGLIIGLLITSMVLLILFILHERRATMPLINLHLFRNATFSGNLVVATLGYGIRQGCFYFLTVQLQGQCLSFLYPSGQTLKFSRPWQQPQRNSNSNAPRRNRRNRYQPHYLRSNPHHRPENRLDPELLFHDSGFPPPQLHDNHRFVLPHRLSWDHPPHDGYLFHVHH